MIEAAQIHKFAQLLALELTDGDHRWVYVPQKRREGDYLHCAATIRREDGLEFQVSRNPHKGNRDRAIQFSISQPFDTAAWSTEAGETMDPRQSRWVGNDFATEALPRLNASVNKTPATIARAVRKMIPDAEKFHTAALARVAEHNASADKQSEYAEAMGCRQGDTHRRGSDPSRRIDLPNGAYDTARAEIKCSSIGITIDIDCMTIKQANAVLRALKLKV